jgi:hypothetical protein
MPRPAAACSCAPPSLPATAFAEMAAVFAGSVIHVGGTGGSSLARWLEPLRRLLGLAPMANAFALKVDVQVITAWKGVTVTPIAILTSPGSGSCGYSFVAGRPYLIYAFDGQGGLNTNTCTRTAELGQAAADLAFLHNVAPLAVTPSNGTGSLALLTPMVVLALALAALIALWALRAGRRSVTPSC